MPITTSPKADLDNSDATGSVAYVTDDVRGVWVKSASQYFSVAGERVNVKEFGAKGDGLVVTDGEMTDTGSSDDRRTLTCATSQPFTLDDVGKLIDVNLSGASANDIHGDAGYNNQSGTITDYISASQVVVSFTCAHAVSGAQVVFGSDDSSAVLDALAAKGAGSSLYFPRGNYCVNQEIALVSGMEVAGDGQGVSNIYWIGPYRNSTSGTNLFFIDDGVRDVIIHDLSIRGTNATGLGNTSVAGYYFAIKIATGTNGEIANLTFKNIETGYIWGMGFRSNGDVGDQAGGDPTNLNFKILDCHVHHCADNGINLNTGGGTLIRGCTLTHNRAGGIEFAGSRIQIVENYIAYNRQVGTALGGLGNPSLGKDNLFANNLVERNGVSGNTGIGVQVGGNVVHAIISNNIIRENSYQGIGVTDGGPEFASLSRDIRITNNQIISNGMPGSGPGFGINLAMNDVVIEGNDIFDDNVSGFSQAFGILVAADGSKLLRNWVRNNTVYDYEIAQSTNNLLVRDDSTSTIQQYEPNGYSGTVDTSGTTATWKSGVLFSTRWVGVPIKINSVPNLIIAVAAAPSGSFTVSGLTVTRTSGTNFDSTWVGKYIRLGPSLYFPIASVADASHLTISNPIGNTVPASGAWELNGSVSVTLATSAGTQSGVDYVIPPHVVYLPDNSVLQTVAFVAAPVFDANQGNVAKITLTGNVTSSILANGVDGQIFTFIIAQDGSGSHTFTFPTNVHGATTIGSTASKVNVQSFRKNGSEWYAVAAGVTNQ